MRSHRLLAIVATLVVCACAGGPGPGDRGYDYNVAGTYVGRLVVDEQRFGAEVDATTRPGGSVRGEFRVASPFEVEGRLEGAVVDDLLRLTVTYQSESRGGCGGRIEGILNIEPGGGVVDGPVTVVDCAERIAGHLSLRRQEGR